MDVDGAPPKITDYPSRAEWLRAWMEHRLARQMSVPVSLPGVGDAAMYLHGSIGYDSAITVQGEVWIGEYELDGPTAFQHRWRPAGAQERLGFLVVAARHIPELSVLLPTRPHEPLCCADCEGTGQAHFRATDGSKVAPFPEMVCGECGGLGWWVAG